jgi:putative ABC transport system permease protein
MFKWLPFVLANLRRRPLRLFFTLGSIIIAFLLFGVMEALRTGFSASIDLAGADRLMTLNKVSIINPMPYSYVQRVRTIPGVKYVTYTNWFGGLYKDEKQQVAVIATEPESFLQVFQDIRLDDTAKAAWLSDRQAMIVGPGIAKRLQIKVGDRIPIRSAFYKKANGGDTWEFNVVGIYAVAPDSGVDQQSMYFHYDYLNESLQYGKDMVGWMSVKVNDPGAGEAIARRIDGMFANSSYETSTSTEKAFAKRFADQIGNIGAILLWVTTAVFFTMLLVIANTMAQSVRERTNEIGVLKTLGFKDGRVVGLVLSEALALTLLGGLIGLLFAYGAVGGIRTFIGQYMPVFEIGGQTAGASVLLMVGLGLVAGLWPAMQAMQLKITDALRRGT